MLCHDDAGLSVKETISHIRCLAAMSFAKAPRFRAGKAPTPGPGQYRQAKSLSGPSYSFGKPVTVKPKGTPRQQSEHPRLPKVQKDQLTLLAQLGRGGLATVHRARLSGKELAVKLVRSQPGLQNPEQDREGLHKEALLLAGLNHANIVRAVCLVTEEGAVIGFGLELLGLSLEAAAQSGQLSPQRLASAVAPICTALAHMHQRLIAHLDVKPANICFTAQLTGVKLVDLDAAMPLQHQDEVGQRLPGNVAAWSPEIAKKQPYSPLAEDGYQAGWTFSKLIEVTQGSPDEVLLRRLQPLLGPAESRPSMQKMLDENLRQPEERVRELLQLEGRPVLLGSRPPQNPLEKLFG